MEGEVLGSKCFKRRGLEDCVHEESLTFKEKKMSNLLRLQTSVPFKYGVAQNKNLAISHEFEEKLVSPRPASEFDCAATKLQKTYKSYRTRRNLADCAVLVEELWWKALDFAVLSQSSLTLFYSEKSETAVSRWGRARTRAAKLGKGLAKDDKAQKLALKHWLEAIDPRHRYGLNLQKYYDVWYNSESHHPFFYWLDVGDGKEVNLEACPRSQLHNQCIKYLGPRERQEYELIVENGMLKYQQSGLLVDTPEGSKWIFVLSASKKFYVGEKQKGSFQHSSFLAGGAAVSAGRLIVHNGILEAIWSYSGHYRPTEENFKELISFLEEHNIDMTKVETCPMDDDIPPNYKPEENVHTNAMSRANETKLVINQNEETLGIQVTDVGKSFSCKWTTGAGPRIRCVRQYPTDLQLQALEQLHLSPRTIMSKGSFVATASDPIPSPRPNSRILLSPRIFNIGLTRSEVSDPKSNNFGAFNII